MPSRKTSVLPSTDLVLSDPEPPKTTRGRKTFRSITDPHVLQALTYYLRTTMMINKDEEVISYFKTPQGIDVKIGEFKP
jgi:hypothetical protein